MTKKLFIIFLTLCLAVVGMTVVAMASALDSIQIAGVDLESGHYVNSGFVQGDSVQSGDPTSGSGYAYYLNGTLYLNNFTVDAGYVYAIYANGDLTIEISGTNSISSNLGAISLSGNLSITGSGSLTAKSGIYSNSSIIVTPATGEILEVTKGSTTSYYSEATSLGTSLSGTVTIQPHTHTYSNGYCTACGAKDYGTIEVGYVTLKDGQYALVDGSSMTVYDGTPTGTNYAYFSGGVLYLNNYLYRDGIFYSSGDLTINLTGTGFVTYVEVYGNLSICGTGSLTVTAENYDDAAITAGGDITIEGVTIDITSNEGLATAATAIESNGSVTISGSDVTLSASTTRNLNAANAIDTWGDIIIENGSTLTATASSTGEDGIARVFYAYGSISIADSTVTKIEASGYAGHTMYAQTGSITITNSTVNTSATATAQDYSTDYFSGRAIYAEAGNVTITGSTVTASATANKSYAVYAGGDVAISDESTVTTTAAATWYNGFSYGIYAGGTATVTGESTVTATATATATYGGNYTFGIYAFGDIAVTGSSTVSSTATGGTGAEDSLAIHSYTGSIDITESEVTVNVSGFNSYGAISTYGANADITITDSKITATLNSTVANSCGAIATYDEGSDIIISGSDISITSTSEAWDWGSISAADFVSISDSKIYAKSTGLATWGVIYAGNGVTISDSELELIASGTEGAYAIYVPDGDLEIESSDVTLTATSTTRQSAIYVTDGDIILTPGTGEALEVTLGTNNPVYHYSATIVKDNAWASYGYVKIAVSNHTHSYTSSVTTEATCTTDGVRTYTCSCGDSYTETIPATGHSYEAVVTAPTCTEKGYTTYTCSVCGDTYTADETAALGHSYDEGTVTQPATCTEAGVKTYTCTVCGETYTEEISATGHSYEAVVTAPTCTETGYTTYTCSACGDTYTADETAALGHTYVDTVTAPTCTEQGYTTHTCSVCGDSYVDTYTAALGHSYEFQYFTWSNDLSTATATFKCKTCGDLYTVDATITGEGSLGVSAHIATVTFEGETYTDTQTTGTSLTRVSADYTAVNAAIKKANALNASDYSNFEYVTAAIDLVNWNLNILNQETVNAYAELIEAAIANLTPIAEETVTITEPVEDSTTETEMEEVEESETPAESNPTTGVVLSLIPIALAMAGSVAGKRR
ncbi:MAG: hypothetical protein LUF29_03465 [Oscillospiraceae bacterium]|nr:hypothetical protein [Oscillospiraceae bacterium]